MAMDCLAGYLKWLKEDGEAVPVASPINEISPKKLSEELGFSYEEVFVYLIPVGIGEYAENHFRNYNMKTLAIPTDLFRAATQQEIDLSQVLQKALKQQLNIG